MMQHQHSMDHDTLQHQHNLEHNMQHEPHTTTSTQLVTKKKKTSAKVEKTILSQP